MPKYLKYMMSVAATEPGQVTLQVVTDGGDGDCAPNLTYQNVELFVPHASNWFQRLHTEFDSIPSGVNPTRCICDLAPDGRGRGGPFCMFPGDIPAAFSVDFSDAIKKIRKFIDDLPHEHYAHVKTLSWTPMASFADLQEPTPWEFDDGDIVSQFRVTDAFYRGTSPISDICTSCDDPPETPLNGSFRLLFYAITCGGDSKGACAPSSPAFTFNIGSQQDFVLACYNEIFEDCAEPQYIDMTIRTGEISDPFSRSERCSFDDLWEPFEVESNMIITLNAGVHPETVLPIFEVIPITLVINPSM